MPGDVVSPPSCAKTMCSSDAVADITKKSSKLALFTQEIFPGGPMRAWCLFSWLWWTVSWTLRCTLPSAVKHNATRLHHGGVWGYRWPAVCLCSAPLGQLEPSISPPTPPVYPQCVCLWGPDQQHSSTRVSHLVFWGGGHFCVSFFVVVLVCFCRLFGTIPSDIFTPIYWQFWHFYLWSWGSLLTLDWNIAPRSTCSRRPLSICRWKELKPIIVFLEGRLHPWTLWHTFKESGHNVFSLIHGLWH